MTQHLGSLAETKTPTGPPHLAPGPRGPAPQISAGDSTPPLTPPKCGGPPTHLSPFDSGGKQCLTAATNSGTVSCRAKTTALGPASNVYATWKPRGPRECLQGGWPSSHLSLAPETPR